MARATVPLDGRWRRAAAALAVAGLALSALPAAAATPPPEIAAHAPPLALRGEARLRVLGFHVYDARLWAPSGFDAGRWAEAPLALEIRYARPIGGEALAETSLAEMRRQGELPDATAERWLEAMRTLFPDVRAGDRITGVKRPGAGARFWVNGRALGEVDDAEFARRFFGIWLGPQTSQPALRQRLVGRDG